MASVLDSLAVFEFPIPACLTLRSAGNMGPSSEPAGEARRGVLESLGVDARRVRSVAQVHSRRVVTAEQAGRSEVEADGLVTDDPELVLAVTVADCVPIYLADRRSGAFGLLHSGRRGTGIVIDAIELMDERYGTRSENLSVLLGPCIGPQSYEVDVASAGMFEEHWGAGAVRRTKGACFLDLHAANRLILESLGVGSLEVIEEDTFANEHYGSYRREGQDFTRMLALLGPPLGRDSKDLCI